MKTEISLDMLAAYICFGLSLFIGLGMQSFILLVPITISLLIAQIFTMPTCMYNKGSGLINKPFIKTYSIKEILQQLLLNIALCSFFYLTAYFIRITLILLMEELNESPATNYFSWLLNT